jgi:hypothetical protein
LPIVLLSLAIVIFVGARRSGKRVEIVGAGLEHHGVVRARCGGETCQRLGRVEGTKHEVIARYDSIYCSSIPHHCATLPAMPRTLAHTCRPHNTNCVYQVIYPNSLTRSPTQPCFTRLEQAVINQTKPPSHIFDQCSSIPRLPTHTT